MRGEHDIVDWVEGNADLSIRLLVAWVDRKHVGGQGTLNIVQPDGDLLRELGRSGRGGLNSCQGVLHAARW